MQFFRDLVVWCLKQWKWFLILGILGTLPIICSYYAVEAASDGKVFNQADKLPKVKVGVVPGCIPKLRSGHDNLYFTYRISAATKLYKAGKIEYILVSGDNSTKDYDETTDMKNALVKAGIPANRIAMDFAGFRTLDTVVRAKKVFGESEFIFISQPFHNKRALFIANHNDIKAVAYNAKEVSFRYGFKVQIREVLARVKMMLDLFITNKTPRFLGDKLKIEEIAGKQ